MSKRIVRVYQLIVCIFLLWPANVLAQDATPPPAPTLVRDASLQLPDTIEGEWSDLANLSRSGAATNPSLFLDAQGQQHIVWVDAFDGATYMRQEGRGWTTPTAFDPPFGSFEPRIVIDSDNIAHVIWLDFEDQLFYSYVPSNEFVDWSAWSEPQQFAENVRGVDLVLEEDELHLAFIQTRDDSENLAGVYVQNVNMSRRNQPDPILVYASPYLRSVTLDNAHVDLEINGDQWWLAWDNPALDWIQSSASADGGNRWADAVIIDQRSEFDGPLSNRPMQVHLYVQDDTVMFIWYVGHEGINCGQYFMVSTDKGVRFTTPKLIFGDLLQCPVQSQLLSDEDGNLLLLTATSEWTYFGQWTEGAWQNRQLQSKLVRFVDQVTFRDVELGCYSSQLVDENLWVAGCDEGDGQDVWLTQRAWTDVLTEAENNFATIGDEPDSSDEDVVVIPTATPAPVLPIIEEPPQNGVSNDMLVVGGVLLVGILIALFGLRNVLRG